MKRIGHLYEKVIAYENVVGAMADFDAKRKPEHRHGIDYRLAWEIKRLMETDFRAAIGKPRIKTVREYGKTRRLQVPGYTSSIAQIALWRACGKYVERRIHDQSFSSRIGKGGHMAARKCERFVHLNLEGAAKYHLYFDVRKFYQHIDKRIMMSRLATVFKDKRILEMFQIVLDSSEEGLPIGYPFSHALANLYLVPLYFLVRSIKFVTKVFVYMDNWLVFSRYKKPLHAAINVARKWLRGVGCEIKGDWQIAPTAVRPVKICGFVVGKGSTRLYRKNWVRTCRDFRRACKGDEKAMLSMASRRGWLRFINKEYSPCFRTEKGKYIW